MQVKLTRRLALRFNSHVSRAYDCWVWTGAKDKYGYGRFTIRGKQVSPARFAYALWVNGASGKEVETDTLPIIGKLCRRRDCVNPEHFLIGAPTART